MNRSHTVDRQDSKQSRLVRALMAGTVILVGMALSAPHELFPAKQVISLETGISDLSCAIEPALRLRQGEYAGRDFIFTYGPLSQLIHGSWAASNSIDAAAVMRWYNLLPAWITNVALWFALAATAAPLSWRAPAYLLWLLLWPHFHIKPIGGLVVVIACAYLLEAVTPRWRILVLVLWALAAPLLALHVFDLGVMTAAALMLSVVVGIAFTVGLSGDEARIARLRLIAAFGAMLIGVAALASTAIIPNPFQDYLRDSWEVATGYAQTMALPLRVRHLSMLIAVLAGSAALGVYFGIRWRQSILGGNPTSRGRAFGLLAAACFCLLMTRYGMTRSDPDHVKGPVGTFVCVAACFMPCYLRGSNRIGNWPALVVWGPVTLLAVWSYADLVADQFSAMTKIEIRRAELEVTHRTIQAAIESAAQIPEKSLYVWPYESIVGLAAAKSNPAYTMQAYAAHTPYLEEKTITRLANTADAAVMYFVNTYPMDDVEHVTRTPLIFRHLVENYAITARHGDYLILRREPGRNAQWKENVLLRPEKTYLPGRGDPLRIEFPAEVTAECRASDLIVLRMSVTEPPHARLLKPGKLNVTLTLSNGEKRTRRIFVAADGRPHEIIVSACNAEEKPFWSMFHSNRLWRASTRVVGLQLDWQPMDLLSVRPTAIVLHTIGTLRRDGAEIRETGLAQAYEPELYDWCFGDIKPTPSP